MSQQFVYAAMFQKALVITMRAISGAGKIQAVLALCGLLAAPAVLQAQLAPPAGWTSQPMAGALVLTSPDNGPGNHVVLTLLPPEKPQGESKSWFAKQALALAQTTGHVLGATETIDQESILTRVVQVENESHVKIRILFYGYPSRMGMSICLLMIPPAVKDQDARLETANQFVQDLAGKRFELAAVQAQTQAQTQAPAQVVRQPNGQYAGANGRTDIDLTYHAKAIPSQATDVPLKGSYLFVGFAYGASYGGVGTTMTWGQQATQQILLLFANGVAAKTDLRGGNLAGHHQAEGFATMDVTNPAVVSGSPFGRWTEDGNGVHIQWNYGQPTDLARNGQTLESKGERWTPYHLADGDRLEGTFVRKMEAGLRSQWMTLHSNGTFEGDGLNVTMGGHEVSPAFPERGSGTYEVRKGSMILRFSNGFTQAIACTLDTSNGGSATLVQLNGFPFERVR